MADNDYVTATTAAELAGVSQLHITSILKEWIKDYIDTIMGRNFQQNEEITITNPEVISIKNDYQDYLIANHSPIISIQRLRDNVRSDSPTTLNAVNYHIENESGIIMSVYDQRSSAAGITQIIYFTKGVASVDLAYIYGFATPPEEVKTYADWLAAQLAKIAYTESQVIPGVDIEVQIGDYREKKFYDVAFKQVEAKYDEKLKSMFSVLSKWRKVI